MEAIPHRKNHRQVYSQIHHFHSLQSLWKPESPISVIEFGEGFVLVKFQLDLGPNKVLTGGTWLIGPYFIVIRRWEPEFVPFKANISTITTWTRLVELP